MSRRRRGDAASRHPPDPRIAELERRVAALQGSLQRLLEQQELERKLQPGPTQG